MNSQQQEKSADPANHRAVIGIRAMEIVVATALLAFGLLIAFTSRKLGAGWAEDGPQAGYFPFYIGAIIALSSLVTLVTALLGRASRSGEAFVERWQLKQVCAVLLPALVYVVAIQWFGIYLASAIYMAVFMVWLGKYPWWKSLLIGIAVSVVVYLMFEVWFQVPLHKGTVYDPLSLIGL